MRKLIRNVVILTFSIALTVVLSGIVIKKSKVRKYNGNIALMPSFTFRTLNRDDFHSSDIKKGPVLIVRFHPDCEHCQYEISQIFKSDISEITDRILLISNDHPDSINKFLKQFNFSENPAFIALADTSDSFYDIFGKDLVPSNYIYNKDLELVKVLFGEVRTETIRKYLLNSE